MLAVPSLKQVCDWRFVIGWLVGWLVYKPTKKIFMKTNALMNIFISAFVFIKISPILSTALIDPKMSVLMAVGDSQ